MREEGVQTCVGGETPTKVVGSLANPETEFPQALYRKHTVLWGIVACATLYYVVLNQSDSPSHFSEGVVAAGLIFLFCSAVHLPDSLYMSRPHPVFWRALEGLAMCYTAFLVFLAFQTSSRARSFLTFFDSSLGVPLPERNYADDCRILTPDHPDSPIFNIQSCVIDVYMLAHLLGWWVKMIVVRDVKLCWVLSLFFEFMEISLRHQLPNFWECWWDSLLLDVLICNAGGIYLGYLTCRYLELRQYHWGVGQDIRPSTGRFNLLSRSAVQLIPFSWQKYRWDLLSSPKNYLGVLVYAAFFNLVDLSNFYLKSALWIPAEHWLLLVRVSYWACVAVILTREYYEYLYAGAKLGPFCWLGAFALAMEWLIVVKNIEELTTDAMPVWLKACWTLLGLGLLGQFLYLVYRPAISAKH